jgi:superfamily II DNA helicase RecQ
MNNLVNIIFDEAHCIKQWGGSFQGNFAKLGHLRYLILFTVLFVLSTATLPPSEETDIKVNLHLRGDMTTIIRLSTDRTNVHLTQTRVTITVTCLQKQLMVPGGAME